MVWLVQNIVKELHIREGDRVLDVGCGDGYILERLRDVVKLKGFGFDISANAINKAAQLTKHHGEDLQFFVGDAENIPVPNNFFDKAVCSEIIEHVPDDLKFLSELHRVLRPKGIAYITFPNQKAFILFKSYCNLVDRIEGHLRRYNPNQFNTFTEVGFKIVKVKFMKHFLMWLVRLFVTYNIRVKNFLKKPHLRAKGENSRPNYGNGLLQILYRHILLLDLTFNSEACMSFYIILQKLG